MKEKARRFVGIVAMVCLSILFGVRKDYPVAGILFIVAISETVGWVDRQGKAGSVHYNFKAGGAATVRDAFEKIGDTARNAKESNSGTEESSLPGESELVRKFRVRQAAARLNAANLENFKAIPTTKITTEVRANSSSTTMHYSFLPKTSTESSINPLPADPPAPGSPSE